VSGWRVDIEAAAHRLREGPPGFVRETPLWKLPASAFGVDVAGAEVWLKLEHLQAGGSFKARGMMNRLLANVIPDVGVVVASGGNAGIATAAAARALGVRCEVFLPAISPEAKRARLRAHGAEVVVAGEVYSDALAACLARQQRNGALLTHAYDQPEVVAGAGTLGREIEAQGGLPDTVLVSVGGGGLLEGGAGGGRVDATPSEPCDIGAESGAPDKASVVALKLSPSESPHWLQKRASNGFSAPQLGQKPDFAAQGDYDGDGKTDVAVWRQSNGVFYVLRSSNGAFTTAQFGQNGDFPVPAGYLPQ